VRDALTFVCRAAVVVPALLVASFSPTAQADPGVKFFHSPSGNIMCEIDFQRGGGDPDTAYCVSVEPPQNVSMNPAGVPTVCKGVSCLSNGPTDAFTLGYGQTTGLGPFTCSSEVSGMTCTVASGRGFTISRSGITTVG
jgi:hypothetical protein